MPSTLDPSRSPTSGLQPLQRAIPPESAADLDGTILLVEDDDAIRRLLVRTLSAARYVVHAHASGESALAFVRNHAGPIDLVVTDTVLPGMNGVETALAIRALRPRISVLRMSGHDNGTEHDGVADASWHFVAKPFRGDHFASTIRSIVGAPARDDREPAA